MKANRERAGSLKVSPENTKRTGRLTTLGTYMISLVTDPNRVSHRLDPDTTSSATLISCLLNIKLLKNRHLCHDNNTVWATTRMGRQRLSDPATYYSFLTQSVIARCHSWVSTAGSLRLDLSAPRK